DGVVRRETGRGLDYGITASVSPTGTVTFEAVRPSDTPEPVLGAVRAYMAPVVPRKRRAERERSRAEGWPELVLLIDTETSIDAAQRLRFGSYRLCRWLQDGARYWRLECIEEGRIYGDECAGKVPQ